MQCKHYKGDGYTYNICGEDIDLCEKCNDLLLTEMKEQKKVEEECSEELSNIVEKKCRDI